MTNKGVEIHLESNVSSITKQNQRLAVSLDSGEIITTDMVLYATGRKANIKGLGLENTAVRLTDSKAIKVDHNYRTDEPSIYAIGDVVGGIQLTPVAINRRWH